MAKVILDLGSGNSCHNDVTYVCKMIDAIKAVDSKKHDIVLKWQLFESAPPNIPLDLEVFDEAMDYAHSQGYKSTASVFDKLSLECLLAFDDLPFIKIACQEKLYSLVGDIPRRIPVYASYGLGQATCDWAYNVTWLYCVSKYPAPKDTYLQLPKGANISDHTEGWEVFNTIKPKIIEKHIVLERDPFNPDAGPFACTSETLSEIM
jgi:sialic acid synthase SpsE